MDKDSSIKKFYSFKYASLTDNSILPASAIKPWRKDSFQISLSSSENENMNLNIIAKMDNSPVHQKIENRTNPVFKQSSIQVYQEPDTKSFYKNFLDINSPESVKLDTNEVISNNTLKNMFKL